MVDFAILIAPMVVGIVLGYFLRERRRVDLGRVTLGVILVLIFSLGFGMGSSREVLEALPRVGVSALVITSLAIGFSVLFVRLARRRLRME
jgi:FtsH-binding integral membrane protein